MSAPPTSAPKRTKTHDPWEPLRHKSFAAFFCAASISNAASWMQLVAVSAVLFDLTHRSSWLGLQTVASLLPAVFLTPYAGVLADRVSRRLILIVTQSVQMSVAFTMWWAYRSHYLTPWRIIGLSFVSGITVGFQTSAWQSFVPLLVPDAQLTKAVKLNSMQYTLARAIGPAMAGWAVHSSGPGTAIFANAITYPMVIAVLIFANPRVVTKASRDEHIFRALIDGALFMARQRSLRLALILGTLMALCGQSLQYMAPAVAVKILHKTSNDNAPLLIGLGIGAVVGSLVGTMYGDRVSRNARTLSSLVMYIIMAGTLALHPSFPVAIFVYGVGGAAHFTMAMVLNTLIHSGVPDHMRGRALSFYFLGILGGIPLGTQILGSLSDAFTVRTALVIDVCVLAALFIWLAETGKGKLLDAPILVATDDREISHQTQ